MLPRPPSFLPNLPLTSSRCLRPRPRHHTPPLTYALPPPVAASLFAVVSVSVTLALRTLLTPPSTSPAAPHPLIRLGRHLRSHFTLLFRPSLPLTPQSRPLASPPQPIALVQEDTQAQLDRPRDGSLTQISSERLVGATDVSDAEYAGLPSLQRRELLAAAFATAREVSVTEVAPPAQEPVKEVKVVVKVEKEDRDKRKGWSFWKMAENVNGRAAALGFMLCLAREISEPGHPSLFEQVVDVVVPIAQKTPPFLVAVCDRVVDLLT